MARKDDLRLNARLATVAGVAKSATFSTATYRSGELSPHCPFIRASIIGENTPNKLRIRWKPVLLHTL